MDVHVHGPMKTFGRAAEGGGRGAGASTALLDKKSMRDDPANRIHRITSHTSLGLQPSSPKEISYLARIYKTSDLYPSRLGVAVATTRPQPQPQSLTP